MTTARDLWSIRPTKLPDVCRVLGIPFKGHHRALNDARACAEIIIRAHSEGVRRTPVNKVIAREQLELLPKLRKASPAILRKKSSNTDRRKMLGDWGEKIAHKLLYKAGFEHVENLNDRISNHPFADLLARRECQWYIIGVKTRNKKDAQGKLNPSYNVRKKGKDLNTIAKDYGAISAWIAIQVEVEIQKYSAFFGTINEIEDKGERFSIPMSKEHTINYQCLAKNEFDRSIKKEWTNQPKSSERKYQPRETKLKKSSHVQPKVTAKKYVVGDIAYDVLKFRPGTKTHRAVTMYLRHGGATNEDIIKENGGPYLNCLTKIKAMGHKIEKQKIVNNRGNLVTSYRIILK